MNNQYLFWGNEYSNLSNNNNHGEKTFWNRSDNRLEMNRIVRNKGNLNEKNDALALASFYDRPEIRHESFFRYCIKLLVKQGIPNFIVTLNTIQWMCIQHIHSINVAVQ